MVGETIGRLTLVEKIRFQGRKGFTCKCSCGKVKDILAKSLCNGDAKSCGCLQSDLMKATRKHEGKGTRLYDCWADMRKRVRAREDCNLYSEWEEFLGFKSWAEGSGYTDELVLCRNGDCGDYCPDNVRWDTKSSNVIEAKSKDWEVIYENGQTHIVKNLKCYCKSKGYNYTNFLSKHYYPNRRTKYGIKSLKRLS